MVIDVTKIIQTIYHLIMAYWISLQLILKCMADIYMRHCWQSKPTGPCEVW